MKILITLLLLCCISGTFTAIMYKVKNDALYCVYWD